MASPASSIATNGIPILFSSMDRRLDAHYLKPDQTTPITPTTAAAAATATTTETPIAPSNGHYSPSPIEPPAETLHASKRRTLKSRVAAGETLYGLFLMSASPVIAEIAGLSGYDYVVVDMEHGPGAITEALSCLRALAAAGTPAVIRVPERSAAWAKKALDLGPQGIMFPMVESGRIAEQVVSYCRYPPRGVRGTAHVMVRASGYGTDDTYVDRCEEELLIFCMVETTAGVSEIENIAAVEGVDFIQMGPRDLGASMGYLRDPGNPRVKEVLVEAERRVLAMHKPGRGPYLGGVATPNHKADDLRARGYHMIAGGVDVGVFRQAAVDDVKKFRNGAAAAAAAKSPPPPRVNGVHHAPSAA